MSNFIASIFKPEGMWKQGRFPLVVILAWLTLGLQPQPHYVSIGNIDVTSLIPPPPAPDSLATHAELDVVFQMETDRSPSEIEMGKSPPNSDIFEFARPVMGSWFTAENLPLTSDFFARIDANSAALLAKAKSAYPERRRPFLVDPRISAPLLRPEGSTYPSGHALTTEYRRRLLISVFPEKSAALQTRSQDIGWSRVIAGVHYPSDITAGRLLGVFFAGKLLENLEAKTAF